MTYQPETHTQTPAKGVPTLSLALVLTLATPLMSVVAPSSVVAAPQAAKLAPAGQDAVAQATAQDKGVSQGPESAAAAKARRKHRKKARHHRKMAAHHQATAAFHRKRAKHMRTWAAILKAQTTDTVLDGKLGKLIDKLLSGANKQDALADVAEELAAEQGALGLQFAAKGAPRAAMGVDAAAVQVAHGTGKPTPGSALLVRRGAFVRMGIEVGEGCVGPGFELRDVASGTALRLPLLRRADGLALTAADMAAAESDKAPADVQASLGGSLSSEVITKKNLELYAERRSASGSPFYSVTIERVAPPVDNGVAPINRAAVALWLPEHTPFGSYALRFVCDDVPVTPALPLVVLFNPLSATTPEYVADKAERAATLAATESLRVGPLALPFQINADWEARDLALALTAKLPLSARAHAAAVSRGGRLGAIYHSTPDVNKVAPGASTPHTAEPAAELLADVKAWNDATGHFDLWDVSGALAERPGRWSTKQRAEVVFGVGKEDYALGAKQGGGPKGLVGTWTFDDDHALDSSGSQNHGANKGAGPSDVPTKAAALALYGVTHFGGGPKSSGGKFKALPKHTSVRVRATVHFVDDWQGETAFLKQGTSAYDSAFVAGETHAVKSDKVTQATKAGATQTTATQTTATQPPKAGASAKKKGPYDDGKVPGTWSSSTEILTTWRKSGDTRVKYGQCWVFAGVSTAMLRSVGVPTRSVTNFDAAHEKSEKLPTDVGPINGGLVVVRKDGSGDAKWSYEPWAETFAKQGGDPKRALAYLEWNTKVWQNDLKTKGPGESIWNFHVWTEARVPNSQGKPEWHAHDSTPQESNDAWFKTATVGPEIATSADDIGAGPALLTKRNPAVWFYPGHARLHVRSGK